MNQFEITYVGRVMDREIYVARTSLTDLIDVEMLSSVGLFVAVFLLNDAVELNRTDLERAVDSCLKLGAVEFAFFGDQARQAVELTDHLVARREEELRTPADQVILTIPESDQSLPDFLSDAVERWAPATAYLEGWRSTIIFCTGGEAQAREVIELVR